MALDQFIKIGDLKGESQDKKYKEWIDVLAWSWGGSNSGGFHAGGGGGAGKSTAQDLSFTKYVDISSPKLQLAMFKGTHYETVEVKIRKAGDKPFVYLEIKMSDCLVTSVSTGGSGGEDRLTENVTINFAKVWLKYSQQAKGGGLETDAEYTYSVAENDGS